MSYHAMLPRPPGKLITWTKGFTCEGVVGKDPVQLLEQALKRAGRPCRVGGLVQTSVVHVMLGDAEPKCATMWRRDHCDICGGAWRLVPVLCDASGQGLEQVLGAVVQGGQRCGLCWFLLQWCAAAARCTAVALWAAGPKVGLPAEPPAACCYRCQRC
jgi:hypothetical protein